MNKIDLFLFGFIIHIFVNIFIYILSSWVFNPIKYIYMVWLYFDI